MLIDFTKKKFDILIQAGQSNAEGYGLGPASEPWSPDGRVRYLNGDHTVTPAAERVCGNEIQSDFSLSFAREYLKSGLLADGRELLILRCAVGGTGFLDHRWGQGEDLFLRMIAMIDEALALNADNRLVALLWHQGEQDAVSNASFETHRDNLSTLLRSVTERYAAPGLPFVAGDFVPVWAKENARLCEPVVGAMRAVCAGYAAGAFVETDGLLSNWEALGRETLGWQDTVHFCRESIYELGRRYFRAFSTVLSRGGNDA